MSSEGRALVQRYIEEFITAKNFELGASLFSDDFVFHGATGDTVSGRDAFLHRVTSGAGSLPGFGARLDVLADEGEYVFDYVTTRFGDTEVPGLHMWRIAGDRLAECWFFAPPAYVAEVSKALAAR